MKKRLLVLFGLMAVMLGVDVSDSVVMSTWSVTNMTGSTQTDFVFPVKVSTAGLLDSGIIGADGLAFEVVNQSEDEVPFAPSPNKRTVEGCSLNATDDTADCQDAGLADVALMSATGSDLTVGTYFAAGGHFQFTRLEFDISTAAQWNTDPDIVWEYCTTVSTACTVFTSLPNVQDDTEGFTRDGSRAVSWDVVPAFVESDESGALPLAFWVRARVTAQVDNADYVTQPVASVVRYELGYANVFPCSPCDDSQATFAGASLSNNQSLSAEAHLGQSTDRTQHRLIVGDDGISHSQFSPINADFVFEIIGSFRPTATGSTRDIFGHVSPPSFIRWDSAVSGDLDVQIDINATGDECIISAASGISDDQIHNITLAFENGVDCELFVDGGSVGSDTIGAGSVTFSGAISWAAEGSVNYIESIKYESSALTISTPDVHFENTDLSTFTPTFIDNQGTSGSAQDGTPSFPLWTANLTGTSTPFLPPTVAGLGVNVIQPDLIGGLAPIDQFVATPVAITLPGSEGVNALLSTPGADIPPMAFWLIFGGLVSLVILIVTFRASSNIVLSMIAAGAIMTLFVSLTIFSVWQVFVFALIGAAIVLVGKGVISSV